MQLMLRKASNTLYVNGKMTFDQMHNYRMAVTEREVINGCLSVGPDHKYWCISFTLQECYMWGFYKYTCYFNLLITFHYFLEKVSEVTKVTQVNTFG